MNKWIRSMVLGAAMVVLAAGGMTVAQEKGTATKKGEVQKKDEKKAEGKFEVYKDKGGKFRFRIFNKEGKNVAISNGGYEKREEAVAVIKAIQEMASAPIGDEKADK